MEPRAGAHSRATRDHGPDVAFSDNPEGIFGRKLKEFGMGIWSFFTQRRNARFVARAAKEVTDRSYATVLDRVRRRAATMRTAEARGYVRSKALEIVHRELATAYTDRVKLDPAVQTAIVSQATDALVIRVTAELRSVPKAAAHPGKRHAA